MRDYSKVGPQFWIGKTGKKLRAAGVEAQLVGMYLMTSPHANMLGLYYVSVNSIGHETGLGNEGAMKGLARCIEADFCSYDEESEMVWVHEMATYQIADALVASDKRCLGIQNEYNALPDNPYLARFFEKYETAFNMTKQRGVSSEITAKKEAPSKPHRSQEQEQEQEQNKNKKKPAQPAVALPDWLPIASWEAYLEMRKEKRKVPTARATELLLTELERLLVAGQDIAAVLDKSTRNGWTDVYAIKTDPIRGVGKVVADIDAINARNNAEAKRLLGITDNDDLRTING
jgi:hypothetical protein